MSFRKTVSVLLAAVLLFSVFIPVACAESVKNIPLIDIRGFMSYTVYESEEDPNSDTAFPPSTSKIVKAVMDLVPAMANLALTKNWSKFGETFIPALNDLMSPLDYGSNGEEIHGTGMHFTYPTYEELSSTLRTDFLYDWRADPFESAAKLNDLVNYITGELGFEKVCIECHSYGGIVLFTYLSEYGAEKVHSCCFNASAVYGAEFAGELLKGNVNISTEALTEFLKGLFSHNDYELLLASLADAMHKAGLTGLVSDFVNDIFANLSDVIWKDSIVPIFGNWPSIWSLCPDKDIDAAYDFVFGNIFSKDGEDHSGLEEKINHYNTKMRPAREKLLQKINDSTNMYVIARYGYYGVPLGNIWQSNTDTVLNTEAEAFGASCKDVAAQDLFDTAEKYVSPDGVIDASGCLFPEQTWFIKNCKHTQKDASINNFVASLLRYDGQATTETFAQYPQFLLFNGETSEVEAETALNANEKTFKQSFINKIAAFFQKVKDFFRSVFSGIFGK